MRERSFVKSDLLKHDSFDDDSGDNNFGTGELGGEHGPKMTENFVNSSVGDHHEEDFRARGSERAMNDGWVSRPRRISDGTRTHSFYITMSLLFSTISSIQLFLIIVSLCYPEYHIAAPSLRFVGCSSFRVDNAKRHSTSVKATDQEEHEECGVDTVAAVESQ
ncbi:unnamed protein product [Angiostrongylus costaricensis]|uniref:SIT4 phosphatase-associated family protein n=1 Tax=Angiostrongylus costaricensis TaxID=334426 RepID=A0A0R3PD64_ANGCS|nr:unnamed protein product [Angiostrongylus costaricensis]